MAILKIIQTQSSNNLDAYDSSNEAKPLNSIIQRSNQIMRTNSLLQPYLHLIKEENEAAVETCKNAAYKIHKNGYGNTP